MSVNAMTEEYEHIELFGKPALFTNARVDTHTVPDGWHVYDLRGSDNDPGSPCTLEILVVVNHAGSIVVPEPISFPDNQDYPGTAQSWSMSTVSRIWSRPCPCEKPPTDQPPQRR